MTTNPPPSSNPTPGPGEPGLTATLPRFAPRPPSTTGPDPLPPGSTISPSPPGEDDRGSEDSPSGPWEESPGPASPSTRSSPASTADRPVVDLAAAEGYRELLGGLFGLVFAVGAQVVRWTRTRARELPPGVWTATETDRAAVGQPLARIAARHAPVAGEASMDLVDGLNAGIAATDWGMRQLELEAEAARHAPPLEEEESRV